jgi:hypothetical protein
MELAQMVRGLKLDVAMAHVSLAVNSLLRPVVVLNVALDVIVEVRKDLL